MGETCVRCHRGIHGDSHVRERISGMEAVYCWECALEDRAKEKGLVDPMDFLKGLLFGVAIGVGIVMVFR